jgi:hypothetical protein
LSFADATQNLSWYQQEVYWCAFEADVINLLTGPLAEAKYTAFRDGEIFNANLVNLLDLLYYGGNANLGVITENINCFATLSQTAARNWPNFSAAYGFVNKRSHLPAISTSAEFIWDEHKNIIHCEEMISLLESSFAA